MSRRNTLGGHQPLSTLSASDLNSRSTMAFKEIGKTSRMSISGPSRRSSIGAPLPRKSSVGPGPSNSVGVAGRSSSLSTATRQHSDPRDLAGKEFFNKSIRSLIDFLTTHNYNAPISQKILTKPTNKDFMNIVVFVIHTIDPNYSMTGKFDDEMISVFKYLQYPFQISKSTLAGVSAPHSWPTLLGCIMWLVELRRYDEEAAMAEAEENEVDLEDASSSEKAFYRYLMKSYQAFLACKDDVYAQLEEQFRASFENKNLLVRDQIDAIEQRNVALAIEIEEVKSRSAYLPQLEAKRRELHKSLSTFKSLIGDLQKELDALKAKVQARKTELANLHTNNETVCAEIVVLRERVNNQELSPEDVNNMLNEKQRLEDAHQQASETRQSLQRKIWELESSLREGVQKLEECVRQYTSVAEDLKLIPKTARNARGEDLNIEIDVRAKKREGLLKTEIRKTILPVLSDLRKELNDTTLGLRSEVLAEQDVEEELELKMGELRDHIEDGRTEQKRLEGTYEREKRALDAGIVVHRSEMDTLEARLLQLKDMATEETKIANASRRINETNAMRSARRTEHARKKAAMIESIMEVVTQCASHRENVQSQLEVLKEQYSERLETFLSCNTLTADSYSSIAKDIFRSTGTGDDHEYLRYHITSGAASSGKRGRDSLGRASSTGSIAKSSSSSQSKTHTSNTRTSSTATNAHSQQFSRSVRSIQQDASVLSEQQQHRSHAEEEQDEYADQDYEEQQHLDEERLSFNAYNNGSINNDDSFAIGSESKGPFDPTQVSSGGRNYSVSTSNNNNKSTSRSQQNHHSEQEEEEDLFSPIVNTRHVPVHRNVVHSGQDSYKNMTRHPHNHAHNMMLNDSMQSLASISDDQQSTLHNLSRIAPDPDPRRVLSYKFDSVA